MLNRHILVTLAHSTLIFVMAMITSVLVSSVLKLNSLNCCGKSAPPSTGTVPRSGTGLGGSRGKSSKMGISGAPGAAGGLPTFITAAATPPLVLRRTLPPFAAASASASRSARAAVSAVSNTTLFMVRAYSMFTCKCIKRLLHQAYALRLLNSMPSQCSHVTQLRPT